jgi:hypothetical protein
MARKVRSWEKGSFSSPVTSGGGKTVKSGTGSTVMSRSFSKPKAATAARASAPRKSKGKVTNMVRPTPGGPGALPAARQNMVRPSQPGSMPAAKGRNAVDIHDVPKMKAVGSIKSAPGVTRRKDSPITDRHQQRLGDKKKPKAPKRGLLPSFQRSLGSHR